jgi:hypothetical protein
MPRSLLACLAALPVVERSAFVAVSSPPQPATLHWRAVFHGMASRMF